MSRRHTLRDARISPANYMLQPPQIEGYTLFQKVIKHSCSLLTSFVCEIIHDLNQPPMYIIMLFLDGPIRKRKFKYTSH